MTTQILVADEDLVMYNLLQTVLTQNGFEVILCTSAEAAIEHIKRQLPQLVIVNVVLPGMDGLTLCRMLHKSPTTHQIPIILLSDKEDLADKIAGFEAGAGDYMVKPFENEELVYRVKNQLKRSIQFSTQPMQTQTARGKIIAVFAPKGGVGKTLVAINLAVALQQLSRKQAVIFDADFSFGLVGVNLNLSSIHDVLTLAGKFDGLDKELVQQVLIRHESGIRVLLCPQHPEDAELITVTHVESIMDIISQMSSYTVVDCPSIYDERTLMVLEKSDIILLVVTPEIGTLMSTSRFLDLVNRLNLDSEKVQLLLNRSDSKVGYEIKDIEKALKIKVKYTLVSGGREVVMSANKGIPMVTTSPKALFSRGMMEIAKGIMAQKIAH